MMLRLLGTHMEQYEIRFLPQITYNTSSSLGCKIMIWECQISPNSSWMPSKTGLMNNHVFLFSSWIMKKFSAMDNSTLISMNSSLCLLNNWETVKLGSITKKQLISFCNTVWPKYKWENGETWPLNRTLNFNTISQLDLFWKRQQKTVSSSLYSGFYITISKSHS